MRYIVRSHWVPAVVTALTAVIFGICFSQSAAAGETKFEWGFYKKSMVKWSTKVPGYDPHIVNGRPVTDAATGVKFKMKWPVNGLVAGHAEIQTPLIISAAETAVTIVSGSTALKVANWARKIAIKANEFDQIVPMGVCEGQKGKLKGELGQFDPETGICYIAQYNGYGWTMEKTKDFKVLLGTPVLATWIPKSQVKAHAKALSSGHYINYQKSDNSAVKTICRSTFEPPSAKVAKAINNTGVFKLKSKTELLIGTVYFQKRSHGGLCVHPYKDIVLGERFPVISKDYEILILETDDTYSRKMKTWLRGRHPVALRNKGSGLCLVLRGKKPTLDGCKRQYSGAFMKLSPTGLVRSLASKKCLSANGGSSAVKCSSANQESLTWFLNNKGYLRSAWGRCLGAPKGAKRGAKTVITKDCLLKNLGTTHKWEVAPLGEFALVQYDGASPTKVYMPGYGDKNCMKKRGGCTVAYMPGTEVKVRVKNNDKLRFSKWMSGPCKGSTNPECKIKVTEKFRWIDFSAFDAKWPFNPGTMANTLLKVRTSGKCIDKTRSNKKGAWVQAWSCSPKNKNQQFQLVPMKKNKAGTPAFVMIKNKSSGMCLDVSGVSKKNGAKIIQWPCKKKSKNQIWTIKDLDKTNWFNLQATHSNKCLDLSGGKKNNGAKFIQWPCDKKNSNQRFRVTSKGTVEVEQQRKKR